MKIKVIETQKEYKKAVSYLEELGDRPDFEDREDLIEQFDLIAAFVEKYDRENHPINPGHPIDIIKLKMDYMGLKQKDLYDIASKGIISEIMNKKRSMSKDVIRKISELLNINQEMLNVPYEIIKKTKKVDKEPLNRFSGLTQDIQNRINPYQQLLTARGIIFNVSTI